MNTVRLYEQWGYLPPVPRAPNGYRQFDEVHVCHVQMVRYAMKCTWIGGTIRQSTLNTLTNAAQGNYAGARESAEHLVGLLQNELVLAQEAIDVVETWASKAHQIRTQPLLYSRDVVKRLRVTTDELRSWERNGLLTIPRAANGYRIFGSAEMDRLLVIRTLRRARYSTMAILRLMRCLDEGLTSDLREILDAQSPDADIEPYPTNNWLSTLAEMCEAADAICNLLDDLTNPP